jgi:SAM-dependent methyltransferase
MKRALAKAAIQFGFGHLPGGPGLYRKLTREVLGTQAGFLTKMETRWRPYVGRWRDAGLPERPDVWFHDTGWTPVMALLGWLEFGTGVTLTDHHAHMQAQHLSQSVDLALRLADGPTDRRAALAPLRWAPLEDALATVDATVHPACDARLPMADNSMDLCHSGGALEHYAPHALAEFLAECKRVVRPGGVVSHVVDHRDHLFHTDKNWPFHAHWALPEPLYRLGFGHALGYHNRLPPEAIIKAFEAAGLERVAVIRRFSDGSEGEAADLPPNAPVGLADRWVRGRWRSVSAADRRTYAAHYLFRVPDQPAAFVR